MGILNITPDSFSDGGRFLDPAEAYAHAVRMQDNGAHIIDIGGESSRPGSQPLSLQKELDRVMPVLEKVVKLNVSVSIDTTKAEVAEEALRLGANMINDISGLRFDPRLADIAARYKAGLVIMHMKGKPENMQQAPAYSDVIREIYCFFRKQMKIAHEAGLHKEHIILDPGIGFGKRLEDNIAIFRNLEKFLDLGCPLMIGASRKSMINDISPAAVDKRLPGSIILAAAAVLRGAKYIRVHDVAETVQALKVLKSIW